MIIFAHIFFAFTIIMFGSDFAAMDGRMARQLSLSGSAIVPYVPWIGLGIYVVTVLLTRKHERVAIRSFGVLGGYIIAALIVTYPNVLFDRFSAKIKTSEWLLPETIEDFEDQFETPTVHYSDSSTGGPWIAVPKDRFDNAMIDWVNEYEKKNVEQSAGENASRPTP